MVDKRRERGGDIDVPKFYNVYCCIRINNMIELSKDFFFFKSVQKDCMGKLRVCCQ